MGKNTRGATKQQTNDERTSRNGWESSKQSELIYILVAWKIRKHLTRVQSLLSDVIDFEGFLPFATLFEPDDWKEAYPESYESDELRKAAGVSFPPSLRSPPRSFQSSSGRFNIFWQNLRTTGGKQIFQIMEGSRLTLHTPTAYQ